MSVIVGIDPGLSGGVAWIDGDECGCLPMPVLDERPDLSALSGLYLDKRPSMVVIERAQAARTAGGSVGVGGFKIGLNYGLILGQLHERGIPTLVVGPVVWKRALGLIGPKDMTSKERKQRSVALAQRLFPSADLKASERCRNYHDGMAEALLLAEYGRREARR